MLQVCDGETLWDYQQVLESQSYRKMSVKPVFEKLNSPEIDAKTREQVMTQMGFAGPEALLVGLRKTDQVRPEGGGRARRQSRSGSSAAPGGTATASSAPTSVRSRPPARFPPTSPAS